MSDLQDSLEFADGLGLAINQLYRRGNDERLVYGSEEIASVIVRLGYNPQDTSASTETIVMISPVIVDHSLEVVDSQEACLSIPGINHTVTRYAWVEVKYFNELRQEVTRKISFPDSVVVQHEIDHIQGMTLLDHMTPMARQLASNKLKKIARGTVKIPYVAVTVNESNNRTTTRVVGFEYLTQARRLQFMPFFMGTKSIEESLDEIQDSVGDEVVADETTEKSIF